MSFVSSVILFGHFYRLIGESFPIKMVFIFPFFCNLGFFYCLFFCNFPPIFFENLPKRREKGSFPKFQTKSLVFVLKGFQSSAVCNFHGDLKKTYEMNVQ